MMKFMGSNTYTIDGNGRRRYRYTHWGTIDDNKIFTPGVNFYHAFVEECRNLVFPADWDLSAIGKKSQSEDRRGAVRYEAGDVDRQYGPTWLLDKVAEETGVKKDLMEVFGGNKEIVDQILTLAYYPFIDNLSYSHLSQWQLEVKAPTDVKMTPSVITRLTERITEKNRMDLFRLHDTLQSMKDEVDQAIRTGEKISDRDAYDRAHKLLIIKYDGDKVKSYSENPEAIDKRLRTSGFFASRSIGLDLDPITAKDTYGMRDEQEKIFELQKGPLGQDRLRVWSEASKHGRMFICFIGLILASFVRHQSNRPNV